MASKVGMTFVMPRYLRALESSLRLSKYLAMAMLSHRQGWSLAVLFLVFPCASVVASDPAMDTYHAGSSEVRITFFATDEKNRTLENLSSDDFAVVDNDLVIRDFRSLARADETALDISILVDTSGSVAQRFGETRNGVLRLLSQRTLSSDDGISLITFSGVHPALLCSKDCRNPAAEQRLLAIKPDGATPLFDALTYTAKLISQRRTTSARQVVILFSDGNDTVSMASARQALDAVIASGAILYAVEPEASRHGARNNLALEQMAEATGGRTFSLQPGAVNALQTVLADLRASYVVTYKLPNRLVGFHSLRILPRHNLNLQFHCRRGYYYEEGR
jgi:VWFA-related protein